MKLRFTITGPKVHGVGYRPYLAELAMRLALRGFEVYNDDEAVITLVEGDEKRVKRFASSIRKEIPPLANVEDIVSEEYIGDVMPLWQFAYLNTASQMNKVVPILLEIRDNTRLLPEMKDDLKKMKSDNTRLS
jgi:hydrogenase maturation factor HypF (carbamoyltransferase family)